MHLNCYICIRGVRLESETRIPPFYTRVTKAKRGSRLGEETKKPRKKGRKVRRWSTKMVRGDHWTPKPPFFAASRHRLTLSLSPLTRSGCFYFSDSSDSQGFGAVSSLFWLVHLPLPGFFASPLFPLYHYSGVRLPSFLYSLLPFPLLLSTFYPSNSTGYCWTRVFLSALPPSS